MLKKSGDLGKKREKTRMEKAANHHKHFTGDVGIPSPSPSRKVGHKTAFYGKCLGRIAKSSVTYKSKYTIAVVGILQPRGKGRTSRRKKREIGKLSKANPN